MKSEGNLTSKTKLIWDVLSLLKGYFTDSNKKLMAWFLLAGIVVCIAGSVLLMLHLSIWSVGFWAAMAAKDSILLAATVKEFIIITSAFVSLNAIKKFFIEKLIISWRDWLTNAFLDKLIDSDIFLILKRSETLDDWPQRIQEDIKKFIISAPNIILTIFESSLLLVGFARTLWVTGGALSFTLWGISVFISGYLFWLALGFAIFATTIKYLMTSSLKEKNNLEPVLEGSFRRSLDILQNEAENIALEHAKDYHKTSLSKQIQQIRENAEQKNHIIVRLSAFEDFYNQIVSYLPPLLCVPLYFSGLMELGELMQVSLAFSQVNASFSTLSRMSEEISRCCTCLERSARLQQAINASTLISNNEKIIRREKDKEYIKIKDLTIKTSQGYLFSGLHLKLMPGGYIFIKAPSGFGKSTLLKAISGSWHEGKGTITLPKEKEICFMSQSPDLLDQTLRESLAYPKTPDSYKTQDYKDALLKAGLLHLIQFLDERHCKKLSGGEKQRFLMARVFLKNPDWVFMDEPTSALDKETKKFLYQSIKELKATFVIIAHDEFPEPKESLDDLESTCDFVGKAAEIKASEAERSYNTIVRFFKTGPEQKVDVKIHQVSPVF